MGSMSGPRSGEKFHAGHPGNFPAMPLQSLLDAEKGHSCSGTALGLSNKVWIIHVSACTNNKDKNITFCPFLFTTNLPLAINAENIFTGGVLRAGPSLNAHCSIKVVKWSSSLCLCGPVLIKSRNTVGLHPV